MTALTPFFHWLGQFRFKPLRRRFVERGLHRLGLTRSTALNISRHIP